jgi:hypothetical protein
MTGWLGALAVAIAWEMHAVKRGRETLSAAFWRIRDRAPWLLGGLWLGTTYHFFVEGRKPRGR